MQEEKLITIITTLYNKAPYLETWAISVAAQTYLDKARVIVIDDGSTDGSLELMKKYAADYKIPIEIFVHAENRGLLRTILEAYHLLDTKYFTVLDADDYWLTEKKLEKAIDFLEAHKDYSGYVSNYLAIIKNGEKIPVFPEDLPSQTFSKGADSPRHFQTPAIVFRNFFTPDLVDALEQAAAGKHSSFVDSDTLRNYLALHFGKVRFENSLDAVWRIDIGNFGALAYLEKSLIIMQEHYQIFDFYFKQFGLDDNAICALKNSYDYYCHVIELLAEQLKTFELFDIKCQNYFHKRFFEYGENDLEKIVNAIIELATEFKKLGFKITGDKVSVNFSEEYTKIVKHK